MAGNKGGGLTPKQENFCLAYLETGNATEAYRRSYNPSTDKESTLNRAGKSLIDNPKIATRLAQLRAPALKRAQVTLEDHIATLQRLRDASEREAKFDAAIKAEMAIGKVSGLYTDRVDHTSTDGSMSPKAPRELTDSDLMAIIHGKQG